MKVFRPNNTKTGFTLVEIMIVVLIIGILLAIAIPNFVAARESSRAKACIGNLKQIDSAKQQSAMDNKLSASDVTSVFKIDVATPTSAGIYQLAGPTGYMRATPACPSNGAYTVGTVAAPPFCGISDSAKQGDNGGTEASKTGGTDYKITAGVPGKFYHGLSN